jgi:hypothetical protein
VRFTPEQLEAALAEFTANAAVYTEKGEQNGSNEKSTD